MLLTPLTRPLFLLTPLREGRPCGLRRLFVLRLDFYSRPCGRGDVPGTGEVLPALYFYSRPCGRGDPAGTPDAPQLGRLFLLTPLREGRRWMLDGTIDIPNISTHAPAGGATETTIAYLTGETDISTHAPAGGATSAGSPPRGRVHAISTHAPAGGATRPVARLRRLDLHFYSRPCGRGDPNLRFTKAYAINFYSRPCGRGDCNFPQVRHEVLRQIAER